MDIIRYLSRELVVLNSAALKHRKNYFKIYSSVCITLKIEAYKSSNVVSFANVAGSSPVKLLEERRLDIIVKHNSKL